MSMDYLSGDQRLFLKCLAGISREKGKLIFAEWKIGPLNQTRWLTLAIRLIYLWTIGAYLPEICDKLHSHVKFIVEEYAVSWSEIKRNNKFYNKKSISSI